MESVFDNQSKQVVQKAQMFRDALFLVFDRLKSTNLFSFAHVKAISGCGQQHGSVYFNSDMLNSNDLSNLMYEGNCPIWMDSSSQKQCNEIEESFGRERLKSVTGS